MSSRDEFEKWWSSPKRLLHFDWDDESNKWVKLLAEEAWQAAQSKWISADILPQRNKGALGEIELYCKTNCGIEVITFNDYDSNGKLEPGCFEDTSVTEWLYIPGVTLASPEKTNEQ